MISTDLGLSYMNEILESIASFADADTLERIIKRGELYYQDPEGPCSDYETGELVEKRNQIFKAVLEYTKLVYAREVSEAKDGHE